MKTQRKAMPVGIEDFKKLVISGYSFIDKTRFIRDLIDVQGEITLITRPRRFGKTLTLSMLRYFFTPENREDNREIFSGLDIEKAGERYMEEQGTRPVVFLTLKEIRAEKPDVIMELFARVLQDVVCKYPYLLSSDRVPTEKRKSLQRLLELRGNEADLRLSLFTLTQCLESFHKKSQS